MGSIVMVGIKSGICRKISRSILIINKVIYKLNIMQLKHGKYCKYQRFF